MPSTADMRPTICEHNVVQRVCCQDVRLGHDHGTEAASPVKPSATVSCPSTRGLVRPLPERLHQFLTHVAACLRPTGSCLLQSVARQAPDLIVAEPRCEGALALRDGQASIIPKLEDRDIGHTDPGGTPWERSLCHSQASSPCPYRSGCTARPDRACRSSGGRLC